jgi:hypothetical protein
MKGKWNVVRLAGREFVYLSSKKSPLRFPVTRKNAIFHRPAKPTRKWGISVHKTIPREAIKIVSRRLPSRMNIGPKSIGFHAPRLPKMRINRKSLTGIELKHLYNLAPKLGIDKDLFDFHAHIDRTLSYGENKTQLINKIRDISPMKKEPIEIRMEPMPEKNEKTLARAFDLHDWMRKRNATTVNMGSVSWAEVTAAGFKDEDINEALRTGLIYEPTPGRARLID